MEKKSTIIVGGKPYDPDEVTMDNVEKALTAAEKAIAARKSPRNDHREKEAKPGSAPGAVNNPSKTTKRS